MSGPSSQIPSSWTSTHPSGPPFRPCDDRTGYRYGDQGERWSDTEYGPSSRSRTSSMSSGPSTPRNAYHEDEGYGVGPHDPPYTDDPSYDRHSYAASRSATSGPSRSRNAYYQDEGYGTKPYDGAPTNVSRYFYAHPSHAPPSSMRSTWGRPAASANRHSHMPPRYPDGERDTYDSMHPASARHSTSRVPQSFKSSVNPSRSGLGTSRSRFTRPRNHLPVRSLDFAERDDNFRSSPSPSHIGRPSRSAASSATGGGRWGRGML
jgi:hypothetical protein